MVPEWQQAYMDYDFLKSLLKQIDTFNKAHARNQPSSHSGQLRRTLTLYRAFSGLTLRHSHSHGHGHGHGHGHNSYPASPAGSLLLIYLHPSVIIILCSNLWDVISFPINN